MALSICRAIVCVFFALVDICLLNVNTMKVEHLKCIRFVQLNNYCDGDTDRDRDTNADNRKFKY